MRHRDIQCNLTKVSKLVIGTWQEQKSPVFPVQKHTFLHPPTYHTIGREYLCHLKKAHS